MTDWQGARGGRRCSPAVAAARPEQGPRGDRSPQGPAGPRAHELGPGALRNARAGTEPLPALHLRDPHALRVPRNKARPRPVSGPPGGQVSGGPRSLRPSSCVPAPRGHLGRPSPHRGRPRLGGLKASALGGSSPLRAPCSGKARRRDAAGASPPPFPASRNNGGPGRRGRDPRPGPAAGARGGCGPVPPPPRPAAPRTRRQPPARPVPALTSLWAAAACPLLFPKPARKSPPEPRLRHGKLHFGGSGAGRGLPRPRAGGGVRGAPAPARTRGHRLPPARPPVCLGDVPALPAAAAPALRSAPRRAVGPPAVAACAQSLPARRTGTPAGMPTGRQDAAPGARAGDTGARTGTGKDPEHMGL